MTAGRGVARAHFGPTPPIGCYKGGRMPALRWRIWPVLLACVLAFVATSLERSARAQTPASEGSADEGPLAVQVAPGVPLPPELLGRPVTRLEVVTAGGRWQASEQLRRTPLGQPLSAAYARAVLREILATGRYAEATVSASPLGAGALLRVTVLPRRIVTELRVTGSSLDNALVLEAARVSPGDDITVQTLAAAADEIGAGHLDHRVKAEANDEFGSLIDAFNRMAGELAASRRRLERSAVGHRWSPGTARRGGSRLPLTNGQPDGRLGEYSPELRRPASA